ncbi:hypothetical protein D3C72_2497410 [compost metagenome]
MIVNVAPQAHASAPMDPEFERRQKALDDLIQELQKYPLMQTSPMEAMNQIAKWQALVEIQ